MILRILLILILFPFFEAKVYGLVYSWLRPELGAQMAIEAIILGQIIVSFLGFKLLKAQLKRLGSGFFTNVQKQGHALEAAGDALFYGLAGLLLLIPGFGLDVLALSLFLRPVRLLIQRRLLHRMQGFIHVKMGGRGFQYQGGQPPGRPFEQAPRHDLKDGSSRSDIIDVDVIEH